MAILDAITSDDIQKCRQYISFLRKIGIIDEKQYKQLEISIHQKQREESYFITDPFPYNEILNKCSYTLMKYCIKKWKPPEPEKEAENENK